MNTTDRAVRAMPRVLDSACCPVMSLCTGTGLLVDLRQRLQTGDRAVVQALHGMGGIGKTSWPPNTHTGSLETTNSHGGSTPNRAS
jgi:hypothetical protein